MTCPTWQRPPGDLRLASTDIARDLVDTTTRRTLASIETGTMIRGDDDTIDVQALSGGVALDLSSWTAIVVQTSPTGTTWTDRTTSVISAAQGRVRASLTSAETLALSPGTLRARLQARDPGGNLKTFPDDGAFIGGVVA